MKMNLPRRQERHGAMGRATARLSAVTLVGMLALTACLGGAAKPPEVKITTPEQGAELVVGQSVGISGTATGDAVSRVEVIIDGAVYAELVAPDLSRGVPSFPIQPVPWTPLSAGTHAIQLKAYGPPDGKKLLAQSEPLVLNAQAGAVGTTPTAEAQAEPTQAAVPTQAAPQPTAADQATAAPGAGQQPAATQAPVAGNTGAPSLTVTNEFVNVRTGPDVAYDKIGELQQGQAAAVKGKSADGRWWQISFPSGPGGIGWVINDYVQANTTAANVAVASAPPKPVAPVVQQPAQPAQPAQPPALVPLVTVAPPQVQPQPVAQGALVGAKGILRVNANPVSSGATAYANWNIPNFKSGEFDRGDGQGYKGPVNQAMQVDVPGISSARTIRLRWTDLSDQVSEDTITINVAGQAAAAPAQPVVNAECNANNPDWQASKNGNPADWQFCKRRDFEYVGEDPGNIANVAAADKTYNMAWDIYGPVNGLYIVLEPNGEKGPAAGGQGKSFPSTGTGGSFNIKDMPTGCYKLFLRVYLNSGAQTTFGQKFICIGTSSGQPNPTSPPSSGNPTQATPMP